MRGGPDIELRTKDSRNLEVNALRFATARRPGQLACTSSSSARVVVDLIRIKACPIGSTHVFDGGELRQEILTRITSPRTSVALG
jgi:hypothetical protein